MSKSIWLEKIKEFFWEDRELNSFPIIFAKMIFTIISVILIFGYLSLFKRIILDHSYKLNNKILWLAIFGWILTSIRSWSYARTYKRLSKCTSDQENKNFAKRNYIDLFTVYLINYPVLIVSIYFIVTEIFPLILGDKITEIQMYIFAFILGFGIDGLWQLFWNVPKKFKN